MFATKLLNRQLKRGLAIAGPEDLAGVVEALHAAALSDPRLSCLAERLPAFLAMVDESYTQFDRDLILRSRSLEMSSRELSLVNDRLRSEAESQKQVLNTLRDTANELLPSFAMQPVAEAEGDVLVLAQLTRDLLVQREQAQRELQQSELKFRSLISNLPGCVYRCLPNDQTTMLFLSDGIEALCGHPASDFISGARTLSQIVVPADLPEVIRLMVQANKARRSFEHEYRIIHADGSIRWAYGKGQGVFDNAGKLLYYDGLILDNTVAKQAQEEIAQTRTLLYNAIEALEVGFIMYDAQDRLVICNQKFRDIYAEIADVFEPGTPYMEVMQAYYRSSLGGIDRTLPEPQWLSHRAAWRRNLNEGSHTYEAEIGGRWLRVDDTRTAHGTTVSLRTDVTALKQMTLELMHAKDVAEAASRTKSEFLANMSHEIRTPMNGIIGMTDLALEVAANDEQKEYLQLVKSSAASLLVIVNDILDFSKMEAGKLHIEAIPFSLRSTLHDCLKPLAMKAHEKSLELLCTVDPDVADQLSGDPGRLRQLLINLVGNAIKFTASGEVGVHASAQAIDADRALLHIAVRDTGIGIPADKQQLIFDAFSQADTSTTRRYGGTGLGLAICAHLCELMGGRIWVDSEPGRGSTFHFTLQVGTSPPMALQSLDPALLRGVSVLMADDNPTNRRWLADTLSRWGMRPVVASDGREALALLNDDAHDFGLVLLDGHMPGLSGFDVAAAMADRPGLVGHTVMMLTSAGQRGDAARCKSLGVGGYLVKPVSQSELFDAIVLTLGEQQRLTHSLDSRVQPETAESRLITRHTVKEGRYRCKVLLVEDNPVNQKLAILLLEKMGHSVTVANNGEEAVALSEEGGFQLILMDMQMPVMGGIEATRLIRQREAGTARHQPIIAMTANAMAGDHEMCLQAGMDGYISKPINVALMAAEMGRVLGANGAMPVEDAALPVHSASVDPVDLDVREALERFGEASLLVEIADAFREDLPVRLAALQEAVEAQDGPALVHAAHSLLGSAGNLSAMWLYRQARRLEQCGKAGDFGDAAAALAEVPAGLRRLDKALRDASR